MYLKKRLPFVLVAGLLGFLSVGLVGCSKSVGKSGIPVKGKVVYNNKPLSTAGATSAVVTFVPYKKRGNESKHGGHGDIDANGQYTLKSDEAGQEGVAPGWYQVGVVVQKKNPKDEYAIPVSLIPSKYASPQDSGILIEVKENAKAGAYDITLLQ
jgi:hypothetical protein